MSGCIECGASSGALLAPGGGAETLAICRRCGGVQMIAFRGETRPLTDDERRILAQDLDAMRQLWGDVLAAHFARGGEAEA